MKYLLKAVTIIDKKSPFHQQKKDVLINSDTIEKIENQLEDAEAITVAGEDLKLTLGWVDLKANLCDPGTEYKETIESGLDAAAFGGFTHVCSLPSTNPITETKSQVEYQLRKAENHLVQLHPLGALSQKREGKDMTEYYDMMQSGAVAFTDGERYLNSGILFRALYYSKTFGGKMIAFCHDKDLTHHGVVNEGKISALTGMTASPAVAEWIDVERNIRIAEYSEGNLHLTGISTAESVKLIREAKKRGVNITADVHVEHLIFTEEKNSEFDSNYKFNPVLRTEADRKALWAGLKDGTIDNIVSNHRPCDTEEKDVVFDDAAAGTIRLQTVINELMMAPEFDLDLVLEILSERNRNFLELNDEKSINIGQKADLTVFSPKKKWTFSTQNLLSKCKNTYMLGRELQGEVVAVLNNGQVEIKD